MITYAIMKTEPTYIFQQNQSLEESFHYWKFVMNCYHRTKLCKLQYFSEYKFVVSDSNDTNMQID